MTVTLKQSEAGIEVVHLEGQLPIGEVAVFYTKDELEDILAKQIWHALPGETRQGLAFQTQSKSYQDWMTEDEWDEVSRVGESASELEISDFKA
jgi:hypothetical protein